MLFISLARASSLASILCVLVFTGSGIVNPVGRTIVTNRKIRNLENIKGIDKNAEIWKLLYYLRQIKVNARG
jgi:hypothetical protein